MPQRIVNAIKVAAHQTGVDFSYLLKKASQESSFDPNAKASTSSATGLYQFTQQTWLKMVKDNGSKYNLGSYADHISVDSDGVAHADPQWKQAILGLRYDPTTSAEMAGELDKANQASLQNSVGGKIGGTELYLAHFLGAGGAKDFLKNMKTNPQQSAANVLPDAAAANHSVFYAKDGTPRSLEQIYRHFAKKFDDAGTAGATAIASASSGNTAAIAAANTAATTASNTTSLANATTVASASSFTGTALHLFRGTAQSVSGGLQIEGPSLVATMILAQMNDHYSSLAAPGTSDGTNGNNKKTSLYDQASAIS